MPERTFPGAAVLGGRRGTLAVAWSGASVAGRQFFQLVFAVALARILGPDSFGVVSMATIYVTLSALLLDQGLCAALIQRATLPRHAPGATVTVNLLTGVVLALVTLALARPIAEFFSSPDLRGLLLLLGPALILKAGAIAPRAVLSRNLQFRPVGVADVLGSAVGCVAGIIAVLSGAGVHSLVVQTVAMDAVVAGVLIVAARGPVPNLHLRELLPSAAFSAQVFATSGIAFLSRNLDNILVGRFLGTTSLAFYGMAYRILVLPVQLIGQTVNRVMFPAFARMASDRPQIRSTVLTSTRLLSITAVPPMALAASAASQAVDVVLGPAWLPAAPLIAVLALAGARETVFYVTPALMKGLGRAGLALRFEILSTGVQCAGVVVGLQFGVLGVSIGYALAGVALIPVHLAIQRSLCDVRIRDLMLTCVPAVHASAWASAAYLLVTLAGWASVVTLVIGAAVFVIVLVLVLATVHRGIAHETAAHFRSMPSRGTSAAAPSGPAGDGHQSVMVP